jgi:hypothetical protein
VVPTIGRPTLQRTLDSITAQTVPCQFVVCSDLGRVGAGPTMNRAMGAVTTGYVGFVADDDTLDPHYVEWFEAENDDADLFIFRMRYENAGTLPATSDPGQLHLGNVGGSFVIRS